MSVSYTHFVHIFRRQDKRHIFRDKLHPVSLYGTKEQPSESTGNSAEVKDTGRFELFVLL